MSIATATITLILCGLTSINRGPIELPSGFFVMAILVLLGGWQWFRQLQEMGRSGEITYGQRSIQIIYRTVLITFVTACLIIWILETIINVDSISWQLALVYLFCLFLFLPSEGGLAAILAIDYYLRGKRDDSTGFSWF